MPAAPPSRCATLCSRTGCVHSRSATLLLTLNTCALQYTLFANASLYGTPPVRALFFEFPQEPELLSVDRQFMVGSDILVTPVLTSNVTSVSGEPHSLAWHLDTRGSINPLLTSNRLPPWAWAGYLARLVHPRPRERHAQQRNKRRNC